MLLITILLQFLAAFTGSTTPPPAEPASLYRSTDMGQNWVPFAEGLPEKAFPLQLVEDGGRCYLATSFHGVFVLNEDHDRRVGYGDFPRVVFGDCRWVLR